MSAADLQTHPGAKLPTAKIPFPALPRPHRHRPWLILAGLVVLSGAAGVGAMIQGGWVMPGWMTSASPEVHEASLRLAIVRERQRVEAYRVQHGRLPASLEEAGGTLSGVRYLVHDDGTYLLEADLGRSYVRLASGGSVEAFLGNSLQVILSRPTG